MIGFVDLFKLIFSLIIGAHGSPGRHYKYFKRWKSSIIGLKSFFFAKKTPPPKNKLFHYHFKYEKLFP